MNRQRLLSGIQPTGELHLGNYLGAIKNWVELQDKYESYFCIVDYHAITAPYDPKEMQGKIFDLAVMLLACGLDPKKCTLFVQSDVPEHTELAWILNSVTPLGNLSRMTQFKEKKEQHADHLNAGLYNYPILQAADILIYNADVVPVGDDQLQHLELTREIARNFNRSYGEVFKLPTPIMAGKGGRIRGLDGKAKMSKSLKNHIALNETSSVLWDKLRTAFTDPNRKTVKDPGNPHICNIYTLHEYFSPPDVVKDIESKCQMAGIGCVDCKRILLSYLEPALKQIQDRAAQIRQKPDDVHSLLRSHAQRARSISQSTLTTVKEAMGLSHCF